MGPFSGLQAPRGVASHQRHFYVVDSGNNRVVKWASGTNSSDVVAFTGLNNPDGLAIINTGFPTLYVADTGNNRVLNLADDRNQSPTVLAFTGLNNPHGVAAYEPKAVYVTDTGNNRVVKLTTDRNAQTTTQSIAAVRRPQQPARYRCRQHRQRLRRRQRQQPRAQTGKRLYERLSLACCTG